MNAGESRILDNLLTQAANAINSGDKSEALACIKQALLTTAALDQAPAETADEAEASIAGRLQAQRTELFGIEAVIGVAMCSIDSDENYDLHRVLEDAHDALDALAGELDNIAADALRAERVQP